MIRGYQKVYTRSYYRTVLIATSVALAALFAASQMNPAHGVSANAGETGQHQQLRVTNSYKTPEEVVSYYCARDAEGFIWSGMLNSERSAFTEWEEPPQADSFYVARKYEVASAKVTGEQAVVEVKYDITGIGDANGTHLPLPQPGYVVQFTLKRVAGTWKIIGPKAEDVSPVVLESRFPYATAQR